jgi:hypothetical protein
MIARFFCWLLGHQWVYLPTTGEALCRRCRLLVASGLALLVVLLAGACRPPTVPSADELGQLRLLVAAARPMAEAAAAVCVAASQPDHCADMAWEVEASLADADQLLDAAEACSGEDRPACLAELQVSALEVAPRLAERLARLVVALRRAV